MATNGLVNNRQRNINGVVIFDAKYLPATLQFGAAETWPAGAVLGRLTANGRYVRYEAGVSTGAEVPSAVLTEAVTATAAGNIIQQIAIQGEFRADELVDDGDTAITDAIRFALRTYSIIARDVNEITFRDNS